MESVTMYSIVQRLDAEDQQLLSFVQDAVQNPVLQQKLVDNVGEVMAAQDFTANVASVVLRMVPHLTLAGQKVGPSLGWWAG